MKLSQTDKRIVHLLQGDLPVVERPFAWLAGQVSLGEAEIVERIRQLKEAGIIRRFGATLYHQRSGYPANVMVAWRVPQERLEEVGRVLSSFRRVTHCYQRRPVEGWPYNLYSMVHGQSEADCSRRVARMAERAGLSDYQLLFSRQEFKKTSMRYFA